MNLTSATLWALPIPATRLVGLGLDRRSAGIKDLRFGAIRDEDWIEQDPAARTRPDGPRMRPLRHARYLVVAGTLTADPEHPLAQVVGDSLVTSRERVGARRDHGDVAVPRRDRGRVPEGEPPRARQPPGGLRHHRPVVVDSVRLTRRGATDAVHRRARAVPQDRPRRRREGDQPARRRVGARRDLPGPRALPQAGRARHPRPRVRPRLRGSGRGPQLHPRVRRGDGPLQHRRRRHGHQRPDRHGHPGAGPLRERRPQGALPAPGHRRRDDRRHRGDRARRRQRRGQPPHPGHPRRRRVGDQRHQALHHQRHPGRLAVPAGPHLRRGWIPRHEPDRRAHRHARVLGEPQARQAGPALVRHRRAVVRRRAGAGRQHHRRGRPGLPAADGPVPERAPHRQLHGHGQHATGARPHRSRT